LIGAQTGGPAAGVGAALNQIIANGGPASAGFSQLVVPVLNDLTAVQKRVALTQLAPSPLTSGFSVQTGNSVFGAISPRQNGFAAAAGGRQYASLDDNSDDYGGLGSNAGERAAWGKLLGGGAIRADDANAAAYSASFTGLVFGADVLRTDQILAGVAASWANAFVTGSDVLTGSSTRLNSYQVTAYGTTAPAGFGGRLSIDGQLGIGYNTYSQTRQIDFLGARPRASYDGEQYLGSLTVGYAFTGKTAIVTPYGAISEAHLVNNGYSETGAGVADLRVARNITDTFSSEFGVRIYSSFDTAYGLVLPNVKLGWTHDYTSGPIPITGALAGVSFVSATARPAADGAAIGAGVVLQRSGQWKLGLEYQGDLRSDFQSHTGVIKATFKF
jgi:outer membrane autotransporter protein